MPPSDEDLKAVRPIQNASGEYILQNYTQEDLTKAKATLEEENRFKGEVSKENAEKVNRGESPSFSRLLVDFGLTLPADWKLAILPSSRYEGVAPAQSVLPHEEKT
jgi:hypothetical protein